MQQVDALVAEQERGVSGPRLAPGVPLDDRQIEPRDTDPDSDRSRKDDDGFGKTDLLKQRGPRFPGGLVVFEWERGCYWASFRIWFAFVPASLIACSGVALPVMTETYMFVMTSRMSCWPRTFGSGIDVLIAS